MVQYGVPIPFGVTAHGEPVTRLALTSGGLECEILTYGGTLAALRCPDRDGRQVDVALGFDTLAAYEAQDKFMGALIGRCANRIGGAAFSLHGRTYPLAANDGANHLHGGPAGFYRQVWRLEELSPTRALLSLHSPDGQEGYPGNLSVTAAYALDPEGLTLRLRAVSDTDTLCSLTGHGYFNLAGQGGGPMLDHLLQIFADAYTPTGEGSIPTGELTPVAGTPLDFRAPVPVGAHIGDPFPQLQQAGGYDHNWVLRGPVGDLRPAARVVCPSTGIALRVDTTLPGLQFYSGNNLAGAPDGKGGAGYQNRWGFCLEPQFFPDAPHHPAFPQPLLRAGEIWAHTIRYGLSRVE